MFSCGGYCKFDVFIYYIHYKLVIGQVIGVMQKIWNSLRDPKFEFLGQYAQKSKSNLPFVGNVIVKLFMTLSRWTVTV